VGLRSATAINVATMVGAGPFITLPLVVAALHGSVSIAGWIVGALIALCDGLVWAELASRYPRSGATYAYLRDALGPRFGPGAAFLFVWQYLFWAPLILASGYIGFSQYAAFLIPALASPFASHALAIGIGVITLAALWRAIPGIARIGLALGVVAIVTLVVVAFAGITHPHAPLAASLHAAFFSSITLPMLGAALVITLYDYSGYADICALGDEVIAPTRTIPRSIVISVLAVAAAYIFLNIGVVAALAPADIQASTTVASTVVQRAFGTPAAIAVTIAVLLTAFGSTYGLLLAAARVPFAAARDGAFFAIFTRLHPRAGFPMAGLLTIGLLALPASLFTLDTVISALTAGIVLVQGVGQIIALACARARDPHAPFRMPLYPLPALVALAGWLFLFCSTGVYAIDFGIGTLLIGLVVYLVVVRPRQAVATLGMIVMCAAIAIPMCVSAAPAKPVDGKASWGHAELAQRDGEPTLLVDGKPFFFWGGAFFYERIPADQWRETMIRMQARGANTLDLYIPWNWHELSDGNFDFDGHTNPRRNLREVLRLGKELGFHFVLRPGPVIRNEWRNGGYPAWLLSRPEYGMPQHDVLEGRYPATATLQNANSDDAAAEWMRNRTHMHYAARWLHRVLTECAPVADRVIAVQLDDDQAAYSDNQTYPAPHLRAYLAWLQAQSRGIVGPRTPVYINTYDMRVPASLPIWTMGNWYQSDAYALADHDRSELDFATAILRTNTRGPLAQSEFQAGWLAPAEDPAPRPADPQGTELALFELLGLGVHGIIDFPMDDTQAPFGWEAPFANALYGWNTESRDTYVKEFGLEIDRYGDLLAETVRYADVAIAYPASSYPGSSTAGASAIARFRDELQRCTAGGFACNAVDLSSETSASLRRYGHLVVPDERTSQQFSDSIDAFRKQGGHVDVHAIGPRMPGDVLIGRDGTFLVASNWTDQPIHETAKQIEIRGRRFNVAPYRLDARSAGIFPLDVALHRLNGKFGRGDRYSGSCPYSIADDGLQFFVSDGCSFRARINGHRIDSPMTGEIAIGLDGRLRPATHMYVHADPCCFPITYSVGPGATPITLPTPTAGAERLDAFSDGQSDVMLSNAAARAIIVPDGGGRMPIFAIAGLRDNGAFIGNPENAFDATGALRDDVLVQPAASTTDRIRRWTSGYPAGMFNRTYSVELDPDRNGVRLAYDAPDVVPNGARFERVVRLAQTGARLIVDERLSVNPGIGADAQRLIEYSALTNAAQFPSSAYASPSDTATSVPFSDDAGPLVSARPIVGTQISRISQSGAIFAVTVISWSSVAVEHGSWRPERSNGTLGLTMANGWRRVTYALEDATSREQAKAFIEAERQWVAANPPDEHP
jgi:amino acid transporter